MACRSRQAPVDRPGDAGGNHVEARRGELLRGNDQRVLVGPIEASSEGRQPRCQQLVVVGDDDDVELPAPGLASELPGRHTTVADEGVHVEIRGEHELIAGPRRAVNRHTVERRARDHRTADEQQSQRARGSHAPNAPMIRTDSRVASSM